MNYKIIEEIQNKFETSESLKWKNNLLPRTTPYNSFTLILRYCGLVAMLAALGLSTFSTTWDFNWLARRSWRLKMALNVWIIGAMPTPTAIIVISFVPASNDFKSCFSQKWGRCQGFICLNIMITFIFRFQERKTIPADAFFCEPKIQTWSNNKLVNVIRSSTWRPVRVVWFGEQKVGLFGFPNAPLIVSFAENLKASRALRVKVMH